jgi:hypothetical protein
MEARCCPLQLQTVWVRAVAESQVLILGYLPNPGKRDWQLGVAELKSCSGWPLATSALYQATPKAGWPGLATRSAGHLWSKAFRAGGVEQAAVGNRVTFPVHYHRTLTTACT